MKSTKLALAAAFAVGTMALGQANSTTAGPQDRQSQSPAGMQSNQSGQSSQKSQSHAQSQSWSTSTQSDQQKLTDKDFVKKAASGGLYEVESAKLAADKVGQEHKEHVKRIEQDHKKANDQLKQIAQQKNLEMPSKVEGKHEQMLTELRNAKEDEFTKKFASQQIKAHKEAIKLYQQASRDLQDQELKQFAQEQLPKLQEHLSMIQSNHPEAMAEAEADVDINMDAQPAGAQIDVNADAKVDTKSDPALKDNQPGHTTHENPGENLNPDVNR